MKKTVTTLVISLVVLFCGVIGFWTANAQAEDWYAINKEKGRCEKNTPAEMIKLLQGLEKSYKVIDEKIENGKPVQVKLIDFEGYSYTYYLAFGRCSEALKAKNEKKEKELERYK